MMMKLKLALLFSICLVTKSVDNIKYKGRKDYKLKSNYILDEIYATSHVQCLLFCSSRVGCISASYSSPTTCLLSTSDTTDDNLLSPGIPGELESVEGWTTFSKARFPVFHALGPYHTLLMTFDQARELCRDYGTTVATRSDLLEARALGYEMCVCGWLSDESIGFVLQAIDLLCNPLLYNDGIITCYLLTANAWCKVK